MADDTYVFQISGIKSAETKRIIIRGICKLGGKYIGGSIYQHACSHLVVPQVLPSEKFLAACAAGKWVVTPNYVLDSVKNGFWLSEESYEVAISTSTKSTFFPARQWREKVANGTLKGAFQGWQVLLKVQEPSRWAMFNRLLRAGRAKVFHHSPPSSALITHVIAKPITEQIKFHHAACYSVCHIVQHLFGKRLLDMNFNLEEDNTDDSCFGADFYKYEQEIKDFIQHNYHPRIRLCEFQSYPDDPNGSQSQTMDADFSQIATMIECGLFTEALDSIMSRLFPGLLPPAQCLVSLLEYAQQGNATSVFLGTFQQFLQRLLITNPPWIGPKSVKKYFSKVFQCPCCKTGLWPFLESCICYCLLRNSTCHPLPGPALPALLHFHSNLLTFIVKLFNGELYAITRRVRLQLHISEVVQESAGGCVILGTFWTVWERSTLLSNAVKQLTQLLIDAASEENPKNIEKQEGNVTDTVVELLSVVVEFWCQHNMKLNQALVEKGLKDFAEHFTVICQKLSPSSLAQLIVKFPSSKLKLALADSIFRGLCCRNGTTVGDDPLCVKKIMQQYLPALEGFSQSKYHCDGETFSILQRAITTDTSAGLESTLAEGTDKGNILKGLNRVNAAGETLLHRACKRNQVETVVKILALPDSDVNVKDHAGWTPLHEACNHGSTACVKALLCHWPAPVVNSQVGGVSPLHDALLNGHMDIAKLLLEHAGSILLQQKNQNGQTPLDLVREAAQREELLDCALAGDAARTKKATEVQNLPLLEAASFLLILLIMSYQGETGLHAFIHSDAGPHSLCQKLLKAIKMHSFEKVTSAWKDQQAVRLLEDVQTLMDVGKGVYDGQVSQPIRECEAENTQFLMGTLAELKSKGTELLHL